MAFLGGVFLCFGRNGQDCTEVARGTTCEVRISRRRDGRSIAIKVFKAWDSSDDHKRICKQEYLLLKKLNHENIVEVLGYNSRNHTLVFEALYTTVFQLLKRRTLNSFDQRRSWFRQLCEGLAYLHANNIAHRDLKLENLMVDESFGQLKIIDFGASIHLGQKNDPCYGICGSEQLMAPEVFRHLSYEGRPVDIWALGIIMYQFFNTSCKPSFPWAIAKIGNVEFEKYLDEPDSLAIIYPLCGRLLCIDVEARDTIQEVLEDSFFEDNEKCLDDASLVKTKTTKI